MAFDFFDFLGLAEAAKDSAVKCAEMLVPCGAGRPLGPASSYPSSPGTTSSCLLQGFPEVARDLSHYRLRAPGGRGIEICSFSRTLWRILGQSFMILHVFLDPLTAGHNVELHARTCQRKLPRSLSKWDKLLLSWPMAEGYARCRWASWKS